MASIGLLVSVREIGRNPAASDRSNDQRSNSPMSVSSSLIGISRPGLLAEVGRLSIGARQALAGMGAALARWPLHAAVACVGVAASARIGAQNVRLHRVARQRLDTELPSDTPPWPIRYACD